MRIARLVLIGSLAVVPATASAQRCFGHPDFDAGAWRIGLATRSSSEDTRYSATLATGQEGGQFIDGHYSRAMLASDPLTITSWGLRSGTQIDLRGRSQLQLCPYASITNAEGSYLNPAGTRVGSTSQTYALGAAAGMLAWETEDVSVRPTMSAELRFASAAGAVTYEGIGGATKIGSTNYFGVTLGVGLVLHRAFTVTPSVFAPVGLKGGTTALGLAASWNFGH